MCAARLFNFCTNERLISPANSVAIDDEDVVEIYMPSDTTERVQGNSMMRDILVEKIYHSGLSRPARNRQRNQRN